MLSLKPFVRHCNFLFRYGRRKIPHIVAVNAIDVVLFALSAWSAFLLRFDFRIPSNQMDNLLVALAVWVPLKAIAFHIGRIDRVAWRYLSLLDFRRLAYTSGIASCLSAVLIIAFVPRRFPYSLYVIDLVFSLLLLGAARLLTRSLLESAGRVQTSSEKVFVYGAGAAGVVLLREIGYNPNLKYQVCGFIDDNPAKRGMTVHGVAILGDGRKLAVLAAKHDVTLVLIAIPSANGTQMVKILDACTSAKLNFRTMPSLSEMVSGSGRPILREVAVEDLLGRNPVQIEHERVATKLEGQVVLVTGAAGSIGSELCRQVARFGPKMIVGFDTAETPLFHLEQDMRKLFPAIRFEPVVGNMQNLNRLEEVFDAFTPRVVFHAAAYKHVPMMEANLFEAIENNVIGTYHVALAAGRVPGCDLIMISSDKAVRPASIMGLTKRLAEMIVCSVSSRTAKFVSVRFGNVLASNGSVVPIFQQQIAAGRPITVTHPEMRRYFMTIPEAVQLVLQAYAMGNGREIFVLDMGQPVKILDLARSLILLSGLRPDEDIKIEFTGIRPGEKLYEEVTTSDEETCPTYHEKIRIFSGNGRIPQLDDWLSDLRRRCAVRDIGVIISLKELVTDYNPSASILQRILEERPPSKAPARDERRNGKLAVTASGAPS